MNTTVTVWVTVPNTHDYYGPQAKWGQFAYDAVVAANNQAGVNYAEFDNNGDGIVDGVTIVHQGRGQEESGNTYDIWSHSWDLGSAGYSSAQRTFDGVLVSSYTTQPEKFGTSAMVNIGVFCHEFGHNLGAPDFYDADYSTGGQYEGTGNWDIMASGSWNNNGIKPAHHNAWTKAFFGWSTPVQLTGAQNVILPSAETNAVSARFNTTTSNEYYLVENRQQTGFDVALPGHGMIIWHVDGNYISSHMASNNINTTSHQGLFPMAANSTTANGIMASPGTINTTGASWPGSAVKTTFTDATIPNAKSWAGANTNLPLSNIAENASTKEISFCFISCSSNTLAVTPSNQNVTSSAGTAGFTVTSNTSWTVTSNQSWCTVTPSGSGNGTITATYSANTSTTPRVANITVNGNGVTPVVVTVTQAGATITYTLAVTPSNQNVSSSAGTAGFTVTSNTSWTATSNQSWCTVTPSGSGNGTITATFSANTSTTPRVANITVSGTGVTPVVVTVTQAGATITYTLAVTPSNQNVTSSAGTAGFTVTSNTSWTATSNQNWCTVTPSGTGNGTITATFSANTSTTPRVANITVSGTGVTPVVVSVTQAGATITYTLSVTPSNQNVSSSAGTAGFTVTSNTSWTVTSNQSWCTVTPSGSGNGTITATYSANTSTTPRVANITVSGTGVTPVVISVTQAGSSAPPALSVNPLHQWVSSSAGSTTFNVTSNTTWTATSNRSWCTLSYNGNGNGTIIAHYTSNPYFSTRKAYITVSASGVAPVTAIVTQSRNGHLSVTTADVTVTEENGPATLEINADSARQTNGTQGIHPEENTMIRVYPNPTSGKFTIVSGSDNIMNVRIMDINGRMLISRSCMDGVSDHFDLSSSPEGIYLIKINAGNSEVTRKLIISK